MTLAAIKSAAVLTTSLRKKLLEHNENLIAYGCSAHIANLLAHDLDIPHVKNPIIEIAKHIRNNHSAAAAYKEA